MNKDQVAISPDMTLQQVADDYILPHGKRFFIVWDRENPKGVLTVQNMKKYAQADWSKTRVVQAMTPVDDVQRVTPETDLWDALELMDRSGINQESVVTDDRFLGTLNREDILSFLQLLRKLKYDVWKQ